MMNGYLGPYVVCRHRDRTETISVWACSNERCREHGVSFGVVGKWFCASCGIRLSNVTKSIRRTIKPKEVVFRVFNELRVDDKEIVLGSFGKTFSVDDGDLRDLTEVNRMVEIEQFEREYDEPIAKLREVYDDVRVRWGLYFSNSDEY